MPEIEGEILRFTYHSEETGYSVLRLETGVTAVGYLSGVNEGEKLKLTGEWANHPKYGMQFKFESYIPIYPATSDGIAAYLSGGLIKGIGPVMAKRIVKKFKDDTLDIIENDPGRLSEVEGIGDVRIAMIKKGWQEHKAIKDIMLFLQSHKISPAYAVKIYKNYGNRAAQIVKENPYRLTFDIWGIGFKTADQIGRSLGFEENHPKRLTAGIIYVFIHAVQEGHVYLPNEDFYSRCETILGAAYNDLLPALDLLEEEQQIVRQDNRIYMAAYYYAERGIEENLERLQDYSPSLEEDDISQLRLRFDSYSEEQIEAIRSSIREKVMILTGGPGTGKTTALKGVIDVYMQLDKNIRLAAPTGRAAKRMTEVIGFEAKTIHRLLEYNPVENAFSYNEFQSLQADLIVIDEASMIDTLLMHSLLKAVGSNTTLLLVGDVDQLPPVGAGNVLRDLIDSDRMRVTHLTKIFRQAEESHIITNAHAINRGEFPTFDNSRGSDFFFAEENINDNIPHLITELASKRVPSHYRLDPVRDIQVLTPMYRGPAGADNLNQILQQTLNQNQILLHKGHRVFRLQDKVMQLRNNYDKEVFNGDIGYVAGVSHSDQTLTIRFERKVVSYEFSELDELTLAYAISVHKSQGSEYPCVILPMTTAHYILLQRNLLYTAITRAKSLMIIVGSKKAISIAIKNNTVGKRFTSLYKTFSL